MLRKSIEDTGELEELEKEYNSQFMCQTSYGRKRRFYSFYPKIEFYNILNC